MFRWIIGSSLQFRILVLASAAALIVFGSVELRKMPVDVFPEFAPPVVEIQTEAIGLSAVEVENLITLNLEELLSAIPWLKSIRSQSVTGLSSILLTFERGTDLMKARQMIQERLTLAYTLPNVAQPPVILQPLSATSRFMMVAISSETIDPTELSLLARWTIKPRLTGVPGVANVAIWGQRLRQLQVQIDPDRLHEARVMQNEVIAAAGDALWVSPLTFLKGSAPGTGGWIDNRNQRLGVEHSMPIKSPEDMAKLAISPLHLLMAGKSLTLGELTEVTFAHPPLIGDAFVNDGGGLLLVLEKLPFANTLEVTREVDRALAELGRGLPGVKIDNSVFRLASYIEASMSNLAFSLSIGAILMLLALGAFLYSWRCALISAVSISLSLLAAVIALQLTRATINTMILAGLVIALGVVIDEVVVDLYELAHRLREERGRASISTLIQQTAERARGTAAYATLIVLLAVTPIFLLGGVPGTFLEPLGMSYLLAVLASMVVALTVTPALGLTLLGRTAPAADDSPFAAWLAAKYQVALQTALDSPRRVVLGGGLAVVAALATWPFLGHSLVPALREGEVLVNWSTPPGTSHAETYRITSRVSRELRTLPGIRGVAAHVGRAVAGDQVVGINSSQIWIGLDAQANYPKTLAAIRETVEGYPGIGSNVQTYVHDKVSAAMTGESNSVVVRLYGPKREVLAQKAEEVRGVLSGMAGLVDLRAEGQAEEPQVQIKVDLDAAGRASVKPGDVRRSAATVFSGLGVGFLFDEQKIEDVVVWSAPEARRSLNELRDLWVERGDRRHVRLADVAQVSVVPTPTVIKHERIAPYVDVTANVAGRDLGSINRELHTRLAKVQFPLEYHPEVLGEYAERLAVQRRMLGSAAAVLIGIFLLLQACFGSWRLALVGFLAIPISVAGGFLAAFVTGAGISLGSSVAFLAVLGVAARNAIFLIKHYQRLQEAVPLGQDLVVRGARERLSPIVASSTAIVAALLPMAVLGWIPGLEIARQIAIVIVGGAVTGALVALFVVPALYFLAARGTERPADLGLAGP
jgi:CzcA family heavy metal efflux pump